MGLFSKHGRGPDQDDPDQMEEGGEEGKEEAAYKATVHYMDGLVDEHEFNDWRLEEGHLVLQDLEGDDDTRVVIIPLEMTVRKVIIEYNP